MLVEQTLFGEIDRVAISIDRIRHFEPDDGYYLADSGGKDSSVARDLLKRSGVKYDSHYMVTTIDPPDLVRFIREHHPETERHYPPRPYFKEIVRRGFPHRNRRWCCEFLKEWGGADRWVVTGIRHSESRHRLKRRMVEPCNKGGKMGSKWYLNPIIDWGDAEVWEYIHKYEVPYCHLYDEGWKRIGCLGCPCSYYKRRNKELNEYPRIRRAYQRAFHELYEKNRDNPAYARWSSGEEMFLWWLQDKSVDNDGVMPLFV